MKLGMSYLGAYLPEHLGMDLTAMRDMGCDEVLITLSENDFHILPGKVQAAPGIAHDLGLRLIANFWGFACAFGGGRVSRLLTEQPDIWIVESDGTRRGEGCMNHPALRARAKEMVERCVAAGYDGFFWDEPTQQDCYCVHCQAAFAQEMGSDLRLAPPEQVQVFRVQSIVSYVAAMSDYVKTLGTGLETATCVMPHDRAAWQATAAIPSLDTFGTDPYWLLANRPLEWVTETYREAVALCRQSGKRSQMWLQGWQIPAGREDEIAKGPRRLAAEGPDTLYTWSYRGGLGSVEVCADPERAWRVMVDVYRELRA